MRRSTRSGHMLNLALKETVGSENKNASGVRILSQVVIKKATKDEERFLTHGQMETTLQNGTLSSIKDKAFNPEQSLQKLTPNVNASKDRDQTPLLNDTIGSINVMSVDLDHSFNFSAFDSDGSEYLPLHDERASSSDSISSRQDSNLSDESLPVLQVVSADKILQDKNHKDKSLSSLQVASADIMHSEINNNDELPSSLQSHTAELKKKHKETNTKKTQAKRHQDFCFFCEEGVLNFARHIMRNHVQQPEVQKIISYPKKSNERKKCIISLRKKGNYLINSGKLYKPMRASPTAMEGDYLPCSFCLGYYKKKQLWRHRKQCSERSENNSKNVQPEAQNFALRHLKVDLQLREQVFPRMRADKKSLVAKKDSLICAFGARYLKQHREKHFINVTSRKMRELAHLLIEIRKKEPRIQNLVDALQPQYYDVIVEATKVAANYDSAKDKFNSPTYAMNIATSLKQCASIAILYAVKKNDQYFSVQSAEAEAGLKTIIQLLSDNWKFDVSSQASDDLNLKKWNKVTLVPLASDLKLLKEHLIQKSKVCADAIMSKRATAQHYNDMVESIYCRVLLLNRRRPGELQRLLLDSYLESENAKSNYEEIDKMLSETERILLRNFKRVVIRGKRNRGVPVLFSTDVQNDISLLLSVRHEFIPQDNSFLFARMGYNSTICGYKILTKNATECGAKNADAISATRLRKHLATLTQVLHMTENDVEQLSTFMGHTAGVHKKSYRLPDDIYQTAKMSKLLLLMEDGKADQYKGKRLEEIDINMDEELVGEENVELEEDRVTVMIDEVETVLNERNVENVLEEKTQKEHPNVTRNVTNAQKKKKRELIPWTDAQKTKAKEHFKTNIRHHIPPKKSECEELIGQFPDLFRNKNWLKIKVYIQNVYTKKCK